MYQGSPELLKRLDGHRVFVGVCGGIAAYKVASVVSGLVQGGAVVQVLAVPGFRPGYEVPLDGAIQRLNNRFALTGGRRLPLHAAGVDRPRPTSPGVPQ